MGIDLKRSLCAAFCDDISVQNVPAGYAISTGFDGFRGDPIGFYVVGPDAMGRFRVQDDGRTMPYLEAAGADLSSDTRKQTLLELLSEYRAEYDDDTYELRTDPVSETQLPLAAMRFVSLMLRVQDLLFLTQERVATTFREDVVTRLTEAIGDRAEIHENAAVSQALGEYEADLVIKAAGHDPVAVFLATYDGKLQEAMFLQLVAQYEAKVPCKVVALLEANSSVSSKMRQRADNRLEAVPVFKGDEQAAIAKIQRMATGDAPMVH